MIYTIGGLNNRENEFQGNREGAFGLAFPDYLCLLQYLKFPLAGFSSTAD